MIYIYIFGSVVTVIVIVSVRIKESSLLNPQEEEERRIVAINRIYCIIQVNTKLIDFIFRLSIIFQTLLLALAERERERDRESERERERERREDI